MRTTTLKEYNNEWYQPGGVFKRSAWYLINVVFFINPMVPFSGLKRLLLRIFGAQIGMGVVIKPGVNIKYPWKLRIGDYTWIGEGVWIDNLGTVTIGANCCVSQGAMVLCGNHNYKKSTFDLIVEDVTVEDSVWVGAKAVVTGGVTCKSCSVLTVGSVAVADLQAYGVYQGNPAQKVRERIIDE